MSTVTMAPASNGHKARPGPALGEVVPLLRPRSTRHNEQWLRWLLGDLGDAR